MASLEEIRQVRLEKLHFLISKGINPYPATAHQDITCEAGVANFDQLMRSGIVSRTMRPDFVRDI